MTSHVTHRAGADGAAATMTAASPAEYAAPPAARSMAAQVTTMLALVTGLWVAISPWFLTLQSAGGNATANDLIVGLAIVALAVFAVSGSRGFPGLQGGNLLLGIWLIISPFILAAKFPVTAAMYWSNIWAGGVIAVLALASLGGLRRARAS